MSSVFVLSLPAEELDFDLCLFCGQVFRFVRTPEGYAGFDGVHSFIFRRIGSEWEITGNRQAFDRLFRLDLPRTELVSRLIAADATLEPVIQRAAGLRTMRPSNAEETFFSFLCTSNNHIARITAMIAKLAAFGEAGAFPPAEVIASLGGERLRDLGFGYRAESIVEAARRLRQDPSLLPSLKVANYEEAFRELLTFKGVGPKLADCICLFALDHTEAVPVDTHMWQAFCRQYRPDLAQSTLGDKRMREVGDFMREKFGKDAGFAHHFLFVGNLKRKRDSANA